MVCLNQDTHALEKNRHCGVDIKLVHVLIRSFMILQMVLATCSIHHLENYSYLQWLLGFRGDSDCKDSACNAGDPGSVTGGRSPGGEHGNPLHYSCLKNSMDRGASWAIVQGFEKSQTLWAPFTFTVIVELSAVAFLLFLFNICWGSIIRRGLI